MSLELLRRVSGHLQPTGLLSGYSVKYHRWSDEDVAGGGEVIVFRMGPSVGSTSHVIQSNNVEINMLCSPGMSDEGNARMLQITQYLRDNYEDNGVFNIVPVGSFVGPTFLQNKRVTYELLVTCMTEDH